MTDAEASGLLLRTVVGGLWWFCTGVGGVGAVATIVRLSTGEPVAIFRILGVAAAVTNAVLEISSGLIAAYATGLEFGSALWVVMACQLALAGGNVFVLARTPPIDAEGPP